MILKFMIERLSWIVIVAVVHGLTVLIAYLDTSIPLRPILYITFLSFIIFVLFLIVRYQRETRFYKSLGNWEHNLDITQVADPRSPFEQIVSESMLGQTKRLKTELTQNQVQLEQEKDELLSWIHEVKTPLTAMRLIIDRLEDAAVKNQLIYEWLRIHLLLDQQLHQKRIPFMENDLYIEKIELEELIYQEIKTLQSWCMQKGIGFDVELKITEVLSDAKWLGFILRQLLTNAVKYSEASDIVIRSELHEDRVQLAVTDFGRGMDAKDLPRIFDKGFTSTMNHQDHAATGMGLYLAKKAARPLLIHIEVESKTGEGSTFYLTFPKRNEFVNITGGLGS
ncbi:sensor histidine kinase [Marinicrinis lubricantis]|uniref:histidine kinase n=1 Tax=Marinicrinis lubricantis TaxID=2086470 RepID=A0ABW1IV90_9BACL